MKTKKDLLDVFKKTFGFDPEEVMSKSGLEAIMSDVCNIKEAHKLLTQGAAMKLSIDAIAEHDFDKLVAANDVLTYLAFEADSAPGPEVQVAKVTLEDLGLDETASKEDVIKAASKLLNVSESCIANVVGLKDDKKVN